ncbi:MAG TPA: redoxin domain-containing protein [Gaiellaceae bacterium]|nr:redoxin domain-containing protein [Gaiellaceae bacterium]
MRRLRVAAQLVALAGVAGLLALLVWGLGHQGHAPRVGAEAPGFTLKRLVGAGEVSLAAYRGRPVVLNFWASWCEPCKGEAKVLERDWGQYRNRVVFLGIDYHDLASDARHFVDVHSLTFPMLADGSGSVTNGKYDVSQVPETYVVGRDGRILAHLAGPITDPSLAGEFRSALAKAAA